MKLEHAIGMYMEYHRMNSRKHAIESYGATLTKFQSHFDQGRELASITSEEIFAFLSKLTEGRKQLTRHIRYSHLKALFNFIRANLDSALQNPCDVPMLRKLYRPGKPITWSIIEKETIDEIIFRTTKARNRIILELMARGGMRVGEVLSLTPKDINDQKLIIKELKVPIPSAFSRNKACSNRLLHRIHDNQMTDDYKNTHSLNQAVVPSIQLPTPRMKGDLKMENGNPYKPGRITCNLARAFLLLVLSAGFASSCAEMRVMEPAVPPVSKVSEIPKMPKVPPPSADAAQAPPGYRVEVVMTDLTYASSVEFDDRGNMYVAEAGFAYGDMAAPGRITRVSPQGEMKIIASQLEGPVTDLLWHRGQLYVSQMGKISVVEPGGSVRDLVTGLPSKGDHHNNQLTTGPDGKIYFGQGTATNSGVVGVDNFMMGWLRLYPHFHDVSPKNVQLTGKAYMTMNPAMMASEKQPPMVKTSAFKPFGQSGTDIKVESKANGTILRMNPDGSGLEVYAWGLRNPFGLLWGPDGNLYATDNGFDERGSRPIANAPDAIWVIREGAWYGWPDYAAGVPVTDHRFKPSFGEQPEFLLAEHPPVEKPLTALPEHTGVTKIDFSTSDRFGYKGRMFVGEFGDQDPMTGRVPEPHGRQVIVVDPETGKAEKFFSVKESAKGHGKGGLKYVDTAGPKRPVDVRFSPDGTALYVVDFGAFEMVEGATPVPQPVPGTGVVWRITREGTQVKSPPANLSILAAKP